MTENPGTPANANQERVFTERDMAGAMQVLATASDNPSVFGIFSDEELLGLAGPEAGELTGFPFFTATDMDKSQAASVALRSLFARGLLVADPEKFENEGDSLTEGQEVPQRPFQLARELAGLLTLRLRPLSLVNTTRRVADQTTSLVMYFFPEGGVLEELVTVDGFHHFSVPTMNVVAERLMKYVDQNEVAGDDDGEPITGQVAELEGEGEIAERLADSRAISVVTAVGDDLAQQKTIMATSREVFAMDTPTQADEEATVQMVSKDSLQELLSSVIQKAASTGE